MMAFLSKLSENIGLTVSNLFVIDQTVILSVRCLLKRIHEFVKAYLLRNVFLQRVYCINYLN